MDKYSRIIEEMTKKHARIKKKHNWLYLIIDVYSMLTRHGYVPMVRKKRVWEIYEKKKRREGEKR